MEPKEGYSVIGARFAGIGGEPRREVVFVMEPGEKTDMTEDALLSDIEIAKDDPSASIAIVTRGMGGFSREFETRRLELRAKRYASVRYFDLPFKHEVFPESRTVLTTLVEKAQPRVPESFREEMAGTETRGTDLVRRVVDKLRNADEPQVHLVLGKAGAGKSVFFAELCRALYKDWFLPCWNSFQEASRPFPLTPEHLRDGGVPNVRVVLSALLHADVAGEKNLHVLTWMVKRGKAILLFDGLEEMYARDSEFSEEFL